MNSTPIKKVFQAESGLTVKIEAIYTEWFEDNGAAKVVYILPVIGWCLSYDNNDEYSIDPLVFDEYMFDNDITWNIQKGKAPIVGGSCEGIKLSDYFNVLYGQNLKGFRYWLEKDGKKYVPKPIEEKIDDKTIEEILSEK